MRARRALLHSYCCVDYARLLDVTQLRLFRLRRALKDALQDRWGGLHLLHGDTAVTLSFHCFFGCTAMLECRLGPGAVWGDFHACVHL
jgi:hypothetical protein